MPKCYPQELKEQAGGLYEHGRTYAEVASALGVGAMTVRRWVREIGIPARSASEAAKLSPRVKLAREKGFALLKRTYVGSERHLGNLAKLRASPKFKQAAREAAVLARERARKVWVGSPGHLAHLESLHRKLRETGHYRRIGRLACHAKNTGPERTMRALLSSLPEAEGFQEQFLIDVRASHTKADFAWPEKWLALYVDGPLHYRWHENQVRDDWIGRMLHRAGWSVMRIPDAMLKTDPIACQRYIAAILRAHRVIVVKRGNGSRLGTQ